MSSEQLSFARSEIKRSRYASYVVHIPGIGSATLNELSAATGIGTAAFRHRIADGVTDPERFFGMGVSGSGIKPNPNWRVTVCAACRKPAPITRTPVSHWGYLT